MIDFVGINAAALAIFDTLLAEWFPAGRRIGSEYVLGNLHGDPGRSLSINIRTGKWADFSANAKGGDPISLYAAAFHGNAQGAAADELAKRLNVSEIVPHIKPPLKPVDSWISSEPPNNNISPNLSGFPTIYPYRNADGEIVRYVCRKEATEDQKKTFIPVTWGDLNGAQGWHRKHPNEPRCLYGLDRLASMPDRTVIVCEGEKAADAAQEMLPDYPCVAWSMGTSNVTPNDWSVLEGRRVILWPDNDDIGQKAMATLRGILSKITRSIETLNVSDLPPAADAADVSTTNPVQWLTDRLIPAPEPEPDYPDYSEYEQDPTPQQTAQPTERKEGIAPLGHDRGTYYYLSMATGQVEAIQASQHSRGMLTHLASEAHYWQRTRFINKNGVDWHAAADDLMVRCRSVGIFDPNRLRGRGAWLDNNRPVLHLGDRCIVDGAEAGLLVDDSRHVYEHSTRLEMDLGDPLTTVEANRLRELCVAAPWEAPNHMGQLLAGWCVIAPVCGAMPWRPHLWLSSEGGGGKTWVLDNIIKPAIGPIALEVQSKTTEAGIRQTLGCDARPVIFDEAETQNERDRDRVQHVLDLARQASSEGGAAIIKGSANGKAMQYHIRSCFAFSSINVGMSQAADESRTVVLTLAPDPDLNKRNESFAKLKALHTATITPGFSGRLLARTLSLLPTIRLNAVIFAEAIARSGKPRRTGDTYGVLMAGAWSLRSRLVATPEEADRMVAETQWVKDAVVKADVDPEWDRALSVLVQHRTRYRHEDVPIGELITWARSNNDEAHGALIRLGIKLDPGGHNLLISNRSTACADIFARTAWSASWQSTISRAPGARKDAANVRFAGKQAKVLSVPMSHLIG